MQNPKRSAELASLSQVPLKFTYSAAGRRNVTSNRQRTDACIIVGTTKYVNLRTDLCRHDEASRPTKYAVGGPAPLPRPGQAPQPTPPFHPPNERYVVGLNLSRRTANMTTTKATPPATAPRGPNPVGANWPPPWGVAVALTVGVAPSGAGVPSWMTRVGVAAPAVGVRAGTTVVATVAVAATVARGLGVTRATVVGDGPGATNLV